jgi:hypothetical protein
MRRLHFDEFEFEPVESEQEVELAISSPRQHGDLQTLLSNCGASSRSVTPPPLNWTRWQFVAEHLRCLAGLELPHSTQWREAVLLHDEWNELEFGVAFGSILIWYRWRTTA